MKLKKNIIQQTSKFHYIANAGKEQSSKFHERKLPIIAEQTSLQTSTTMKSLTNIQ